MNGTDKNILVRRKKKLGLEGAERVSIAKGIQLSLNRKAEDSRGRGVTPAQLTMSSAHQEGRTGQQQGLNLSWGRPRAPPGLACLNSHHATNHGAGEAEAESTLDTADPLP